MAKSHIWEEPRSGKNPRRGAAGAGVGVSKGPEASTLDGLGRGTPAGVGGSRGGVWSLLAGLWDEHVPLTIHGAPEGWVCLGPSSQGPMGHR